MHNEWLHTTFRSMVSTAATNVRDILKAVDQAVREVVCRVDFPLVSSPVMRREENAIYD